MDNWGDYDTWRTTERTSVALAEEEQGARELITWREWSAYWHNVYQELDGRPIADIDRAYRTTISLIAQSDPWLFARHDNSLRSLADRFASEYLSWIAEQQY